ncbi:MAG: hypothetical protein WCI51_22655, partial [Lentisphaerota bacterium]
RCLVKKHLKNLTGCAGTLNPVSHKGAKAQRTACFHHKVSAQRKRQESANGRGMVRMHSLTMHYPHALHDLHGKTVFFVSFCVFCGQKYFGNFA